MRTQEAIQKRTTCRNEHRSAVVRPTLTVQRLREVISTLPDSTPVIVSHQPTCQKPGLQNAIVTIELCYNCMDIGDDGSPIFGGGVRKLLVQ